MGFYKSPEDMYTRKAEQSRKDAARHWAMAKNGDGGFHYAEARGCYERSAEYTAKAQHARETNAVFHGGRRKAH